MTIKNKILLAGLMLSLTINGPVPNKILADNNEVTVNSSTTSDNVATTNDVTKSSEVSENSAASNSAENSDQTTDQTTNETAKATESNIDNWMPDKALQSAVAKQLGIAVNQLTPEDLKDLDKLDIKNQNISSLDGLQNATNLTTLLAGLNSITDLTPLKDLTNLTNLQVYGNAITDLTPVTNLTNLKILNVASNQISDIKPVANLTNLQYLLLNNSKGTALDLSNLNNLNKLTYLNLNNTDLANQDSLAKLGNLTDLALAGDDLKNIDFVSDLSNLTSLDLTNNLLENLDSIKNLTELTDLGLGSNSISDITALSKLTKLEKLTLGINSIKDIDALKNLDNLKILLLDANKISDITPLANLTKLESLAIEQNNITDISPLKNLSNLATLTASKQKIILPSQATNTGSLTQKFLIKDVNGDTITPMLNTNNVNGSYDQVNNKIDWTNITKNGEVDSSWKTQVVYGNNQKAVFSGSVAQPVQLLNSTTNLGLLTVLQANNDSESMADKYVKSTVEITAQSNNEYNVVFTLISPKYMGTQPISLLSDSQEDYHSTLLTSGILVSSGTGDNYESTYQLHLKESDFNKPLPIKIHVEFTNPFSYKADYQVRFLINKEDKTPTLDTDKDNQSDKSVENATDTVNNAPVNTANVSYKKTGEDAPSMIAEQSIWDNNITYQKNSDGTVKVKIIQNKMLQYMTDVKFAGVPMKKIKSANDDQAGYWTADVDASLIKANSTVPITLSYTVPDMFSHQVSVDMEINGGADSTDANQTSVTDDTTAKQTNSNTVGKKQAVKQPTKAKRTAKAKKAAKAKRTAKAKKAAKAKRTAKAKKAAKAKRTAKAKKATKAKRTAKAKKAAKAKRTAKAKKAAKAKRTAKAKKATKAKRTAKAKKAAKAKQATNQGKESHESKTSK